MRYAFYPGCSLESSAKEYRRSTQIVARDLGLDIVDIPGWICCGSTPAHMSDDLLSVALPVYNLVLARRLGVDAVLASCASCYSRLKAANHAVLSDHATRERIAEILGEPYRGDVEVKHVIEPIARIAGEGGLSEKVRRRLGGLKVASYYGCLLVRPPKLTGFDDPEDPQSMDRIVGALGAVPVEWRYKVECCGAALAFSRADVVKKLSGEILGDAKASGADVVVVACPLCHSNLDLRQPNIEKFTGLDLRVPVLYITQLVGLALGHSARELGLGRHMIDPIPVLSKHGIDV